MISNRIVRVLAAAVLFVAGRPHGVSAQSAADTAAVLAGAQRLLDAINTRDTMLARSVLLPGSHLAATRVGASLTAPRIQPDTAFIRGLAGRGQRYLERMWTPTVRMRGSLADVWAPYDFHIDGKFSHCGVDTFTLLNTPSGWKIASVSYTTEMSGCPPSPLGPPK